MKRWLIYFILLLQCFFAACAIAAPQIPLKPTAAAGIYVQDYAQVLSAEDKRRLLSIGQELDNKTTAQLAVVTVKTLDGQPIEDYALSILREWGIGSKEKNNGALIVVAVQDRRSRIEVGYGLEGLLSDGLTGRIQDQAMIPYFRKGNYAAGIVNGYAVTASLIAKDAGVQLTSINSEQIAVPAKTTNNTDQEYPFWLKLLIGAGIVLLLIIDNLFLGGVLTQMLFFMFLRGRGGGGGRGGFGGGSSGGGGSSRSW